MGHNRRGYDVSVPVASHPLRRGKGDPPRRSTPLVSNLEQDVSAWRSEQACVDPVHDRKAPTMFARDVEAVIHEFGEPRCDECIARQMGGATEAAVGRVTSVLGLTTEYKRSPAVCPGCGHQRDLIREAGGAAPPTWIP